MRKRGREREREEEEEEREKGYSVFSGLFIIYY